MRPHVIATVVAMGLCAACDGATVASRDHTVTDSAGVRIVVSERPLWGDVLATLDTTPVVRIASDSAGPASFSFIGAGLLSQVR